MAKPFEVGDILPATTQLKISWDSGVNSFLTNRAKYRIHTVGIDDFIRMGEYGLNDNMLIEIRSTRIYYDGWISPYTDYSGGHNFIVIGTSSLSLSQRTISYISSGVDCFYWEDLNAPTGYTITFNSNDGTTIPAVERATELPTPLPIPTKENHTFLGWYYDSDFTNEAFADDPLTSDVTLYAKWELIPSTITYNSNGGSIVPQTSNVTQLPDPLPTTTKSGYTFVAWYYESNFQTRAKAGDTIEEDTTLYAKWYTLRSLFTEIANAIRKKESSSGTIRDVDFGDRIRDLEVGGGGPSTIELTQIEYDALEIKDEDTYYLIVEVE